MNPLEKLIRAEGSDPVEEESRLKGLFAQIERCVAKLPGVLFYHLEPGEMGAFGRIEWNAWLYVREQDRVFPFRVAVEPGRHSQFRIRINPDMGNPTDTTIITALRDIMREQMTGVDSMYLRLRYWNDNKEEPIYRGTKVRGS